MYMCFGPSICLKLHYMYQAVAMESCHDCDAVLAESDIVNRYLPRQSDAVHLHLVLLRSGLNLRQSVRLKSCKEVEHISGIEANCE